MKEKKVKKKLAGKSSKKDSHGRQTKIAVVIMIILLVSVFLFNWIIQESRKFEYGGIDFYKEKEGEIMYYKTMPLQYLPTGLALGGERIPIQIKLRNDPRELAEIPIEGTIKLKRDVILSLSPVIANCSNTYITLIDFSMTLKAFSITAKGAVIDRNYAKENNVTFADCRHAREKTVIVMKEGNKTKITQNKDCYTIEIKDCEIQESFERFILEFIAGSMV